MTEPVVRALLLPAVLNQLFENPIFISKAIARDRELQRRSGFEEASSKPAQTPIAEPGIRLLFENVDPIDVLLSSGTFQHCVEQQIRDIIRERTADEEFHREVV